VENFSAALPEMETVMHTASSNGVAIALALSLIGAAANLVFAGQTPGHGAIINAVSGITASGTAPAQPAGQRPTPSHSRFLATPAAGDGIG
jgi:hypothetical protein